MATAKPYPFKETPILFGDDAVRFELEIENPVSVSAAERQAQAAQHSHIPHALINETIPANRGHGGRETFRLW